MKVSERKFKVEGKSPTVIPYSRCTIDRFRVIATAPERLRTPPGRGCMPSEHSTTGMRASSASHDGKWHVGAKSGP